MSWDKELPFFSKTELVCKHCGELKLNTIFAAGLVALRFKWNEPLSPTSVCRCRHHNEFVGGHKKSLHMTDNPYHDTDGCAACDILWRSWPTDKKLAFAVLAYSLGFSVGLNETFCHIDVRAKIDIRKFQNIFTYENWETPFNATDIKDNSECSKI